MAETCHDRLDRGYRAFRRTRDHSPALLDRARAVVPPPVATPQARVRDRRGGIAVRRCHPRHRPALSRQSFDGRRLWSRHRARIVVDGAGAAHRRHQVRRRPRLLFDAVVRGPRARSDHLHSRCAIARGIGRQRRATAHDIVAGRARRRRTRDRRLVPAAQDLRASCAGEGSRTLPRGQPASRRWRRRRSACRRSSARCSRG